MDIAKKLREQAKKTPDRPFIIFKDKNISFKEAVSIINRIANFLLKRGVKKGERVAIYLPNSPEYIFSYFATFTIGAIAVPLDVRLTTEELVGVLRHSEASVLFTKPPENPSLKDLAQEVANLKDIVICFGPSVDNFSSLSEIIKKEADESPDVEINDSDLAIFFYTSGTTGQPKAVMLNYSIK